MTVNHLVKLFWTFDLLFYGTIFDFHFYCFFDGVSYFV